MLEDTGWGEGTYLYWSGRSCCWVLAPAGRLRAPPRIDQVVNMSWSAPLVVSKDHGTVGSSFALTIDPSMVGIFTEESYPQASLEGACRLRLQTPKKPRSQTGVYATGMAMLSLGSNSLCWFWLCSLSTENPHVNGSCVRAQSLRRGTAVSTRAHSERVHALPVVMSMARMRLGSSICELSGRNKSRPPRPWMTPGSTFSVRRCCTRAKTKFVQPECMIVHKLTAVVSRCARPWQDLPGHGAICPGY